MKNLFYFFLLCCYIVVCSCAGVATVQWLKPYEEPDPRPGPRDKADKFSFNLLYGVFDLSLKKHMHGKTKTEKIEVVINNAYDQQLVK